MAGLACGLACTVLVGLSPTVDAQSLSSSTFGGGGMSASADFTLISSFQPSAARPSSTGEVDGFALNLYPGFLAGQTAQDPTATPVIHLVPSGPGLLTVLAVPDVPGWQWSHSVDLQSWFLLPAPHGHENPLLIETTLEREFFRLERP